MKRSPLFLFLAALALCCGSAEAVRYCKPTALKDYNFVIHHTAVVDTRHCQAPVMLRKRSPMVTYPPFLLPSGRQFRIPLFVAGLEYSLDGKQWYKLAVR